MIIFLLSWGSMGHYILYKDTGICTLSQLFWCRMQSHYSIYNLFSSPQNFQTRNSHRIWNFILSNSRFGHKATIKFSILFLLFFYLFSLVICSKCFTCLEFHYYLVILLFKKKFFFVLIEYSVSFFLKINFLILIVSV